MAKSTEYNVTLKATDRASRPVYEMYQKLKREGKALTNNERQRQMLGIRGERQIQAEILRTQRAYNQLARSGKLSSDQLTRAKQAQLKKIRELNIEMGRSERLTKGQKVMHGAQAAGAIGAGIFTASKLVMDPITKRMDFDKSVRGLTKVAYADSDLEGMNAGKENIIKIIEKHVTEYGATIDQVMQAMDGAFRGGLELDRVEAVLPDVLKASLGSGSDPDLVARMVVSLLDNKWKPEDITKALDQAVKSGELGSFELSDMSESFPEILSISMGKGFTTEQLPQVLSILQTLTKSSGSTNAAVTQYKALLSEFNQSNFAERVGKAKYIDPATGKAKDIDWTASLAQAAKDGKTPVEAAIEIMEGIMNSDPALKKAREGLQSDDATVRDQAVSKILESSILSDIFGRDLSLQAMLGLLQNKDRLKGLIIDTKNSDGSVEKNYQFEAQSNDAKAQSFKDQVELKRLENSKALADTYGDLSEILTSYMKEYPELTEKMILFGDSLKIVIAALAAAAITSKLGGWMSGGKGVPSVGGKLPASGGAKPSSVNSKGGLLGTSWLLPAGMALALDGDSGSEAIQNALSDKNTASTPYIKDYEKRHGKEAITDAVVHSRGQNYGLKGRDDNYVWESLPSWQIQQAIEKYEPIRKEKEAQRGVRQFLDDGRSVRKNEVSFGKEQTSIEYDPMQFANNIIAMSQAINALNPLADLPRQLELLQNAKPQEIVLTIPVSVDGRMVYETVERITINQLNRGIA